MKYAVSVLLFCSVILGGCWGSAAAESDPLMPGTLFSFSPQEQEPKDGWVSASTSLALANTTNQAIPPFIFRIVEATILTTEGKTYPAKVRGWRELSASMLDKDLQFAYLPIQPGTYHVLFGRVMRTGEYALNISIEYQYAQVAHPTELRLKITRPDLAKDKEEIPSTVVTIPLGVMPDLPQLSATGQQAYTLTDLAGHLSYDSNAYSMVITNQCGQGILSATIYNKNQLDNLPTDQVRNYVSYQRVSSQGSLWEILHRRWFHRNYIGPGQSASGELQLPAYSAEATYMILRGQVYSLKCQ